MKKSILLFLLISSQLCGCSNKLPDHEETVQPVTDLSLAVEHDAKQSQTTVEESRDDNAAPILDTESTLESINRADEEILEESKSTTDNDYYSVATGISAAAVEQYAAQVRQQFLAQDWAAISSEISYPITISDSTYENSEDFLNASGSFGGSLDEAFLSAIEHEDCVEMFCNYQGIMIGETGQIWIGEILNPDLTSQGLKIIAINGLLNYEVQEMSFMASRQTIAEIPEMDLFLSYGKSDGQNYSDISLHYNGKTLPIAGTTMADSMFMPLLLLLENDSKAAAILIKAEGSGLYLSDVHMVDLEQFSEVPCENPTAYLDQKLKSTVVSETGTAYLELPGRILQFDVSGINSPSNLYEQICYGGIVGYSVENDRLCCDVILHIAPGSDLGIIRLEYEFTGEEYQVGNMEFQEFSFNQVPYIVIE